MNDTARHGALPALKRHALLEGLLLSLGPLFLFVVIWVHGGWAEPAALPRLLGQIGASWWLWSGIGAALATSAGGLVLGFWPRIGRGLGIFGLLTFLGSLEREFLTRPGLTFALGLFAVALLVLIAAAGRRPAIEGEGRRLAEAWTAAVAGLAVAVITWFAVVALELIHVVAALGLATLSVDLAYLLALRWLWRRRRTKGWRAGVLGLALLPLVVAIPGGPPAFPVISFMVAGLGIGLILGRPLPPAGVLGEKVWWAPILEHPARLLVVTFAAVAMIGGALLSLPLASAAGQGGVSPLDAFFTSFSAVCVTGLVVVDTPHDFNLFGQAVILTLIQVGGLGIMTFSTAAMAMFRRRLSLRHEGAMAELLSTEGRSLLFTAIWRMLMVTCVAEVVGALLLGGAFRALGDSWAMASWRGVFTAVSAFCNAGFALQTDSLVGYQTHGFILQVTAALIIIGGLGPVAVVAMPDLVRRRRVSLQVRLILGVTAFLLVGSTLVIGAVEWSNGLSHLSVLDKINNAWFQAATLRTAGFNSIDLTVLKPATLTVMMTMMFIGGSPGSTAGGIKTTTLALLVLAVTAALRGGRVATFHGRAVSHASIYRAAATVTLYILTLLAGIFALELTQALPVDMEVFEVFSALGTVGLSLGATPGLDAVGKVIIMACMFVGRVGPLTLFLLLQERQPDSKWRLVEEEVAVG